MMGERLVRVVSIAATMLAAGLTAWSAREIWADWRWSRDVRR
jgi:hypothetical protein